MKNVIPQVSASVNNPSTYDYEYTVSNGTVASQKIWIFMVAVKAEVITPQSPQGWRLRNANRPGVSTAMWGANDSTKFIISGGSLGGFLFSSSGLPKIMPFFAVGRVAPPEGEFEMVPGSNDIFINSAQGRTIGPADPPSPFVALDFIDTLIAMKAEAKGEPLKWIKPGDLSDLIDERLGQARDYLEAEDESKAEDELEVCLNAILEDCEGAGPVSYLTTEACALLRYNIEYLIDQLE
jgi:hypothetical protein